MFTIVNGCYRFGFTLVERTNSARAAAPVTVKAIDAYAACLHYSLRCSAAITEYLMHNPVLNLEIDFSWFVEMFFLRFTYFLTGGVRVLHFFMTFHR